MDSLVSKRSLDEFYRNWIMPFPLYGLGSIKEALEMKVWELREVMMSVKDNDWQKAFMALHGLQQK